MANNIEVNISFQGVSESNPLALLGGVIAPYTFPLDATFVQLENTTPSLPDPPSLTPVPGQSQPPLPPEFRPDGYQIPQFNHLMLPRLRTQPSDNLLITVPQTKVLIYTSNGTLTVSDAFDSGEWVQQLTGESQGQISFLDVLVNGSRILNQIVLNAKIGDRVEWFQVFDSNLEKKICTAFILEKPQIQKTNTKRTLTLTIGDRFTLKAKQQFLRKFPYCGTRPRTRAHAVNIYSALIQETINAPNGGLLGEVPENFGQESPFEFLQNLYAPLNFDVRCNLDGAIVIEPRKPYVRDQNILYDYQCYETKNEIAGNNPIYSTVEFTSSYDKINPLEVTEEFYIELSPGYNPANNQPFFLNGSTYKEVTIKRIGDSEIYRSERLYGKYPNVALNTNFIIYDPSTCEGSASTLNPAMLTGLVKETITTFDWQQHQSGALLIRTKTVLEQGFYPVEQGTGTASQKTYRLFNGVIKILQEEFTNQALPSAKVCPKDWTHVVVNRQYYEYGLDEEFIYRLLSSEVNTFRAVTQGTSTQGFNSQDVSLAWQSITRVGSYSEGFWTQQPERIGTDDPPASQWIRPTISPVILNERVTVNSIRNEYGLIETSPQDGAFCFNQTELRTLATRIIKDNAAMAESFFLTIPTNRNIGVGDSVTYYYESDTDQQVRFDGLVYQVSYSQQGNQATQTLHLGRWFD